MRSSLKAVCVAFFVTVMGLTIPTTPAQADVQSCIAGALTSAKAAGSNQIMLKSLYNVYFGEALAQSAARKSWKKLSERGRSDQVVHARKVVLSIASRLAEYAGVEIVYTVTTGPVIQGIALTKDGNVGMKFYMSGECSFSDIAISGYPSLASMVGDFKKLTANKDR